MFVPENVKFNLLLHHLLQNKKLGARVHLLLSCRSIHEKNLKNSVGNKKACPCWDSSPGFFGHNEGS